MAFDAGAILARVEIDTADAKRQLAEIKREADDAGKDRKIRLGAEFDNSDISRARQAFASLDNIISRDAANRLRNSPQGSVLGALNSLFSPHPISGAPSASQSAQQGLLGRIAGGQATGAATPGGSTVTGPAPRDYPQQQAQMQAEEKQQTQLLRDIADTNRQQTQSDSRTAGLLSGLFGSHGGGGGGFAAGGLLGHLFGGGRGGGAAAGILGGAGPQILGMGLKTTGIVGGAGSLLGALPGLLGPLAGLGVGGLGLGVAGIGAKLLIGSSQSKGPLYAAATEFGKDFRTTFAQAAQPLASDLKGLFATLPGILHSLQPLLRGLFASAGQLIGPTVKGLVDLAHMVLPLLSQAFRAAAPLMRPLIDGLGKLVAGILPGLTAIIKASAPVIGQFAGILGSLGHDIGGLFSAMAPAVKASEPIFAALMKVLGAIFPIIGKVAAEFAKVLGPVFVSLAKTISQLLPILKPVGMLIAQLAGAILGDLGSAFQAVLILIRDMEPSIRILAGALGSMFKVLENSGVFAMMGDALEKIAPVLAQLVNTLVRGFAPILPPLIALMSKFSTIMVDLMAAGLTVVLKGITDLLTKFPLLSKLLLVGAAAWGVLTLAMNVNPVVAIASAILALIGVITLLVTHWHQVWTDIKNWAEDAWKFIWNGFGKFLLPLLGPAGLIALGLIELAKHWQQVWGDIRNWTLDAWDFLQNNIWHPLENLFENTIPGWLSDAYHFWVNTFINPWKTALQDAWNWIWNNVWNPIDHFLHNTIPGWFDDAVSGIKKAWTAVEDAVKAPINFVIRYILDDGLIKAFNWISSKVGGPSIKPIPTLRAGGTIPGWGGGDSVLAALEPGETVVPKEHSKGLAWLWKMLGIPGYQSGGTAPRPGGPQALHTGIPQSHISGDPTGILGVFKKVYDAGRIIAAIASGNNTALDNAFYALMGHGVGGAVGDMASLLLDIPKTLVHDAVHWLISQFAGNAGGKSGPVGSGAGRIASGGLIRTEQLYAQSQFPRFNWPLSDMGDLIALWNRESGWNPWAVNASSGAAGIAQSLGHGPVTLGDWMAQINWGLNYIKGTYGSPVAAWGHEVSAGWYDTGGWLPPGGSLAWNQTSRREAVLTPAQSEAFIAWGEMARLFARGDGNIGNSSLMRDVYLTLPEGTTVAQAMSEITFRLRTAQMNGYAGVVPGG